MRSLKRGAAASSQGLKCRPLSEAKVPATSLRGACSIVDKTTAFCSCFIKLFLLKPMVFRWFFRGFKVVFCGFKVVSKTTNKKTRF